MNINDYRKAMNHVIPNYELKNRIINQKISQKRYVSARRVLACALAVILMLTCLTSVALAVSLELRTAVLSFFQMEGKEQVPGQGGATSQPDISQAEIGDLVKAQYIKMDRYYGLSGSLFNDLTWSEDGRILENAEFWEVQDNELIPVVVNLRTQQIDITYNGIRYQGEMYWFVWDGELVTFQGTPQGIDTQPEDQWYVRTLPDRTSEVLLYLSQGRQMDYSEYPLLYHLDTGEAEDILADAGVKTPEFAYSFDWSLDLCRALILSEPGPESQRTWLCNLEAGTLAELEDLVDMDAVCVGFVDNNTLILSVYTMDQEDTWQDATCYAYDIPSGQTAKTLDQAPYYRWWDEEPCGVMTFGKNCVYVSETGQVQIIDLKTGERIPVVGFTYQKGGRFMPNPFGDKLLYYVSDPDTEGLGITQLGVVDLEQDTFIAFDREGYNNLHEEAIGWEGDHTVGINATSSDGETRYIILYQF